MQMLLNTKIWAESATRHSDNHTIFQVTERQIFMYSSFINADTFKNDSSSRESARDVWNTGKATRSLPVFHSDVSTSVSFFFMKSSSTRNNYMSVDVSLFCFLFILISLCAFKGEKAQPVLFIKHSQCFNNVVRQQNKKQRQRKLKTVPVK